MLNITIVILFKIITLLSFTIKILKRNDVLHLYSRETIQLGRACNCVVSLSVRDIINISFKPVLRDMASVLSIYHW
ncbi:hypothetical protein BD770DRAFT_400724 [Pilaira anomala]|nr:hypothetical protein BD770DRAFT_400724 [Pilaira anomala]